MSFDCDFGWVDSPTVEEQGEQDVDLLDMNENMSSDFNNDKWFN